ncbi:MAG: PEP-CTERM sorting domain-containing protein [Cyanobacteria bacterium SBLK]|nr:PEP-CTERM sorting domain-containing protein [Cyanobacteria bacterium SBLK]
MSLQQLALPITNNNPPPNPPQEGEQERIEEGWKRSGRFFCDCLFAKFINLNATFVSLLGGARGGSPLKAAYLVCLKEDGITDPIDDLLVTGILATPVPEPTSTIAILAVAGTGMLATRKRKK